MRSMRRRFIIPKAVADIGLQFRLIFLHARDAKTGLLRHGWDESRKERWADKATGQSAEAWARAMGWMMMALVDTLDYLPEESSERRELLAQHWGGMRRRWRGIGMRNLDCGGG